MNDQLSNIYVSGAPDPSQNINPIFLKQKKNSQFFIFFTNKTL